MLNIADEYYTHKKKYTQKDFIDLINYKLNFLTPNLSQKFWMHYNETICIADSLLEVKMHQQNFEGNSYIIIRLPKAELGEKVVHTLGQIFPPDTYDFKSYDQQNNNFSLDELKNEPARPTIIIIKEKMRCSQTLVKKYISVVYERIPNSRVNDDALNEGLVGRMTGYDDNGRAIMYGCLDSCKKLLKIEEGGYNNFEVKWEIQGDI